MSKPPAKAILSAAQIRRISAKHQIITGGHRATHFFLVQSGRALQIVGEVFRRSGSGLASGRTAAGFDSPRYRTPRVEGNRSCATNSQTCPKSKIIFVSQESSPDIVQEALSLETCGWVVKTKAGSDLLSAVDAVLEGRQFISSGLIASGSPTRPPCGS